MRHAPTEGELRRLRIADSIERKRWLDQLLVIVRQQTRDKTVATLARARDTNREA